MFPWPLLPLALIFGVIYHTQFCGWSLLLFLKHTNKFASVKELVYFKHRGWGLEWWRDPCIVTSASPGHWSLGGWAAFFRKSSDLGVVLCSEHPVKLISYGICICCSVAQSCPTLCDPMNCSYPGFPVLHSLPEFAQTHVCWVGDAIQPSHPLSSPSPPALNLSQHQGLFQWVGCLHQVAKLLELQH